MNEIVSRAEQERQGLIRKAGPEFVPALPERQIVLPPMTTGHSTVIDVPANAQLYSVVQTTERDRSAGYLMRTVPLSVAFAIVVVAVSMTLAEEPFLSWSAFVVFWLSFVVAWAFGEYRHGKSSPNAVALEEVKRKWDNIDANDQRRWNAWEKALGIVPAGAQSWVERHKWPIILWVVVTFVWMVFITLVMLGEL